MIKKKLSQYHPCWPDYIVSFIYRNYGFCRLRFYHPHHLSCTRKPMNAVHTIILFITSNNANSEQTVMNLILFNSCSLIFLFPKCIVAEYINSLAFSRCFEDKVWRRHSLSTEGFLFLVDSLSRSAVSCNESRVRPVRTLKHR